MNTTSDPDLALPARVRVQRHYAARILSGECAPGERLPSVRAVAKELGVHYLTVAHAYRQLQADGLIVLKNRLGAFVKDGKKTGEFLIVTGAPSVRGTYIAALTDGILSRFRSHNIAASVRFVGHDDAHLPILLQTLRGLIQERALRGVWLMSVEPSWVLAVQDLLVEFAIPLIHLSPRRTARFSVLLDYAGAIRNGARHLVEEGCRSLAMLLFGFEPFAENAEAFRATCEALRVAYRIEMMPFKSDGALPTFEHFGREAVERLMQGAERPDGLLIMDDFIGRGALATLSRLGIGIPRDLRVCTFARKGDSFPSVFGVPVARLEADDDAVAAAACEMMEQIIRKEPISVPHLRLPVQLIKAERVPC
jgi:DNA-binding LacI/PurR family transcriptional regulator